MRCAQKADRVRTKLICNLGAVSLSTQIRFQLIIDPFLRLADKIQEIVSIEPESRSSESSVHQTYTRLLFSVYHRLISRRGMSGYTLKSTKVVSRSADVR